MSPDGLVCPCGAPAPDSLPPPGRHPVACTDCGTPLVAPGGVSSDDTERALGAALLVASVLAVAWMFAARSTDGAARWVPPLAGALVGVTAWLSGGARGPAVQRGAGVAFLAFVALGEVLLYRGALLTRLIALHAAEGAENPEVLARQELETTGITEFLHLELTSWFFVGFAVGLYLALRLTRAPVAVEAFLAPPEPVRIDAPGAASAAEEEEPTWR